MPAGSSTDHDNAASHPARPRISVAVAVALLFIAYQIPEGIGQRLLHSMPAQGLLLALFYVVALVASRALGYRGFGAYAMERTRGWGWLLGITLIGALGAKAIALYVGTALGVYAIAAPSTVPVGGALGAALLLALASTLLPSIAEDIVTRGVWYRVGPRSWTGARFVIASSLIYVLNHIYRLANGPSEWIMLFVFGLAYATALVRTRTLWAAIGLHWGWNLSSALLPLVADVTVLRADISPYVSVGAHLVMLGAVVVLTRRSEVHAEPAAA